MNKQLTDIDLSQKISNDIHEDYHTALDFIKTDPEYSLLKFRKNIECIIDLIAKKYDIEFEDKKLVNNINNLFDSQVISKLLKDNLHELRKFCNSGIHFDSNFDGQKEFNKSKDKSKKDVLTARKILVSIFKEVYLIINENQPAPSINLVNIGSQQYRETIYNASTSTDFKEKLKAGIIYESIFKDQMFAAPLIVPSNFNYHLEGLKKNALSLYEASYKISAKVDENLDSHKKINVEEIILKHCELEPLYKYAALALSPDSDKALKTSGMSTLKAAADREYAPAEALMGATLYEEEEKNYKLALQYLIRAKNKDEPLALWVLFFYYTDEQCNINIDIDKALKYLQRAVDLSYPNAIATLGELHHKGQYFPKDNSKAKELLEESVSRGSAIGKRYLLIEFNDLVGKMSKDFNQFIKKLKTNKPKPTKVGKKVKRNEPCRCGSRLKYKKCCIRHK